MKISDEKVLSLDTSTNLTGWALFDKEHFCDSGVIDCHKIKDSNERLNDMVMSIVNLANETQPTTIVIEPLVVTRGRHTTILLSKLIGAIYYYCMDKNIDYVELSPNTWRSCLGMLKKGRDREYYKALSLQYSRETYKVEPRTDDESDAICIGTAYYLSCKGKKLSPYELNKDTAKSLKKKNKQEKKNEKD